MFAGVRSLEARIPDFGNFKKKEEVCKIFAVLRKMLNNFIIKQILLVNIR